MAKGWITAKRLKQKTYRAKARGHLKRFSSAKVTAPGRPNPEIVQWYRNAAKGLGIDPELDALFGLSVMPYANQPRQEAMELRNKIKNACPEWMYFRLVDDSWLRARMYFSNNPERCCVVELDKRSSVRRRSIVYKNRDVAYHRWCENTIDWSPTYFHDSIPETRE